MTRNTVECPWCYSIYVRAISSLERQQLSQMLVRRHDGLTRSGHVKQPHTDSSTWSACPNVAQKLVDICGGTQHIINFRCPDVYV